MAMRIYDKADFLEALKLNGFRPSDINQGEYQIWFTPQGEPVSVQVSLDKYPDYILNKYLDSKNIKNDDDFDHKQYDVKPVGEVVSFKK